MGGGGCTCCISSAPNLSVCVNKLNFSCTIKYNKFIILDCKIKLETIESGSKINWPEYDLRVSVIMHAYIYIYMIMQIKRCIPCHPVGTCKYLYISLSTCKTKTEITQQKKRNGLNNKCWLFKVYVN